MSLPVLVDNMTAVMAAASRGFGDVVLTFVTSGKVDCAQTDKEGNSLLHHAVLGNLNSNTVAQIVDLYRVQHCDTNQPNFESLTPLMLAIKMQSQVCHTIYQSLDNVDLSQKDISGKTIFHCAVDSKDILLVEKILVASTNVSFHSVSISLLQVFKVLQKNIRDFDIYMTKLKIAMMERSTWCCGYGTMTSPAQIAALQGYPMILMLLLGTGSDVNTRGRHNFSLLHLAGVRHNWECIQVLLHFNVDITVVETSCHKTALLQLIHAIECSHDVHDDIIHSLECMLKKGADVDHQDIHGLDALHYAAGKFYPHILDILLIHKKRSKMKVIANHTHILYALKNPRCVAHLISQGCICDIDHDTKHKLIYEAVRSCEAETTEMLLEWLGVEEKHKELLPLAVHESDEERSEAMINLLLERLFMLKKTLDWKGIFEAVLMKSLKRNYTRIVERMIMENCNLNLVSESFNASHTPLEEALLNSPSLIIKLVEAGEDPMRLGRYLDDGEDKFSRSMTQIRNWTPPSLYENVLLLISHPRSLSQFCRISIRRQLGYYISQKVEMLPIPSYMRCYILTI